MDLSQARTASLALDLDLDLDDEEAVAERHLGRRTLAGRGGAGGVTGRYEAVPIFEDEVDEEEEEQEAPRRSLSVRPNQGREGLSAEDEDTWDRLG
jgi:hypothetical protein